ncbi:MAG: SCO family protein [Saprospiraceae bacterium]|nr:SCO family protein [Saprospiraceae bacterium]
MRYLFFLFLLSLIACQENLPEEPTDLPILGNHDIHPDTGDTTLHIIPNFEFYNQDSVLINNNTFAERIYVADFFFTSCPTICPKVKKNMLRLYDKHKNNPEFALVSYTIDPKRDTVGKLKQYATNLDITEKDKWHFLTGEKATIYDLAEDYMSIAVEDENVPGGFDHSGWILLIDENRHIRSFCDGTDADAVTKFMDDIDWLLANNGK